MKIIPSFSNRIPGKTSFVSNWLLQLAFPHCSGSNKKEPRPQSFLDSSLTHCVKKKYQGGFGLQTFRHMLSVIDTNTDLTLSSSESPQRGAPPPCWLQKVGRISETWTSGSFS